MAEESGRINAADSVTCLVCGSPHFGGYFIPRVTDMVTCLICGKPFAFDVTRNAVLLHAIVHHPKDLIAERAIVERFRSEGETYLVGFSIDEDLIKAIS